MTHDSLFPRPDDIRRRLEAIDRERRDLRRLLRLSESHHGDGTGTTADPEAKPLKLETK